ncbi:MAG: Calx-beta domain-containing protein, partial [Actinomycetota bacterium]|nr:Calx-beta domain-containing protein [Actinomycetota bacterium]
MSPTSVSFAGSPAGETESVTLTIKGDTDPEIVEQFWLEMTSLSGMSSSLVDISDNASVTITDNDQAVLTIDDVVVNESDNATVTLRLNKAVGADFKVNLTTSDGTATAGSDYTITNTQVTFNATGDNQTPSVTVPINDDSVVEDNETFTVRLTNLTGVSASLVDTSDNATVTITDKDGQATVTINDNNTVENGGSLTFTLSLDKATNDNFTVSYTTVDLSAVGGSDYTSKTDNVSFSGSAGETQTVTISLLGDSVVEDNETFRVVLNQVAGMSSSLMDISDNATGQIDNDDGGASVTIDNLTVTETDGDQTVTVTL